MSTKAPAGPECVALGFISGIHGVQGWVKVHSYTQPRTAILEYPCWLLGSERRPISLSAGRQQGKTLVALLEGVDDREAARALVGQEIAVRRDELPELGRGEYYWADLIGLEVVTVNGVSLGKVVRLLETGANDVLVVQGERERLIPYVPQRYVIRVDLANGRLEVDWDPEF